MNARYVNYTMQRESEHGGLYVVRFRGVKVGTSQSEAAARIIRARHWTRNEGASK